VISFFFWWGTASQRQTRCLTLTTVRDTKEQDPRQSIDLRIVTKTTPQGNKRSITNTRDNERRKERRDRTNELETPWL